MYHITYFYPRSPYGERLYDTYAKVLRVNISIHALLTESDYVLIRYRINARYFYPRSPYGERPMQIVIVVVRTVISIHALLTESDHAKPA